MQSLVQLTPSSAVWSAPRRLDRFYELTAEGVVVANLQFPKLLGSLAESRTADGHWSLKRAGFLKPRVIVRAAGAETDLARFHANWSGDGYLEVNAGQVIQLVRASFWQSRWTWRLSEAEPLMHLAPAGSLLKPGATVDFEAAAWTRKETPLLAVLGWYLMLLMAQDAASTVTLVS